MTDMPAPAGPLVGLRVLEFGAIGPVPFCGMLLADLGADVVRIDRPGHGREGAAAITYRARRSVVLDLKSPDGQAAARAMAGRADVLIEGWRPGVMERLGLAPDRLLAANPRLVIGRMTGWGQDGPMAARAGHDINYIALTGILHAIGPADQPIPPLNLIGDFGGGALYLAMGVLAALWHARATGEGQVVDCAMTDGAASLFAMIMGERAAGTWTGARMANRLDGGAPFYRTYRCADGRFLAVGAVEPQFFRAFLSVIGLDPDAWMPLDRTRWPAAADAIAAQVGLRDRDAWMALFDGIDACVAPVLTMDEAPHHPHNVARGTFQTLDGVVQPAPAPRFSRTPGRTPFGVPAIGQHGLDVLQDWAVTFEKA